MTPPGRGSLGAGFAALSQWKLILLLTLSTAVLGGVGAAPLLPALRSDVAGTLAGDHFIRNEATLAPADLLDFARQREFAILGMRRTALLAGALGVLTQVFFAGGIVAVLGRGRFSFGQFLEPARRNLWHNGKCLLLFLLAGGVLLGGWFAGAFAGAKALLEAEPPDAPGRSAAWWATVLVGALLFAALSIVYDFARAARRFSPTTGAWGAVRFALRVLRGSWIRALALFAFWLVLGAAAFCAALAAAWFLPAVSAPAVVLLFLLQFAALWLRSAARVAAWGSFLGFLEPRARVALASLSRASLPGSRRAGVWVGSRQPAETPAAP